MQRPPSDLTLVNSWIRNSSLETPVQPLKSKDRVMIVRSVKNALDPVKKVSDYLSQPDFLFLIPGVCNFFMELFGSDRQMGDLGELSCECG
jgi:hypothetical protein